MDARAYSGIHCKSSDCIMAISISEDLFNQLVSVISLLSSDTPNLDSPANVDAAKEVRTDPAGQ